MELLKRASLVGVVMSARRLLSARGLNVSRGTRIVLSGIDFNLVEGEIVALIGENGSGKSTLLETLAGLHPMSSGYVKRHDLGEPKLIRDSEGSRGNIAGFGLTLQSDGICGEETVKERIDSALKISGVIASDDDIESILSQWGLEHRAKDNVSQLSDGLRRRVAVLAGLMPAAMQSEPTVVLLDEPSEGLDKASRDLLATWLRALSLRGNSIVIATHDSQMISVADRLLSFDSNGSLNSSQGESLGEISILPSPAKKFDASRFFEFINWSWRMEKRNPIDTVGRATPALVAMLLAFTLVGQIDIPQTSSLSTHVGNDLIAGLVLAPAFITAIVAPALIKRLAEERAGDWWRAMTGANSRAMFSIGGASFILPIPIMYLSWFVIAGDIDSSTNDEVLKWLWLPALSVIDISAAAAALHLMVSDLNRSSAAAGSLLLLVLIWPFLELTSALSTIMESGMTFELSIGEPLSDILISSFSAILVWGVAVIIPED
tara:strand:+ start:73828 stop:75300 length:1473 start_codon:yes stop_codon:yes gene_type:complete